jgi:site-specific DNA-methyltransferase (cytosine-N4-specific)
MVAYKIECIEKAQSTLPSTLSKCTATLGDIRNSQETGELYDTAITSPPYATALPYIDTQRISLVWLGLCEPNDIMNLERTLIGSREFYKMQKAKLQHSIATNEANLPSCILNLIQNLHKDLTAQDGFRRRAVPLLLYRYFADMKLMFENVHNLMKPRANYALVVGCNKTTIGGTLHLINTPELLADIAQQCGWAINNMLPLQTYQRYGLNAKNGINRETLVILKKDAS